MNWDEDEYNSFRLLPALLAEQYQTKVFRSAYEKVMATHAAEKIEHKKSFRISLGLFKMENYIVN